MTAALPTQAPDVTQEVEALTVHSLTMALEDFLRDPIGYGDYDFTTPITLEEFSTCRHVHNQFVGLLAA